MSEVQHTFELAAVQKACVDLISQNAEHLIRHIYDNSSVPPYNDRTIRVGLALKTLLKSSDSTDTVIVGSNTIAPIMKDLSELINRASTSLERKVLLDEMTFLQRCTQLEELVTLNTRA